MKIQIFCQKVVFEFPLNLNRISQSIRKNFSVFNKLLKKDKDSIVVIRAEKKCKPKSPILSSKCKLALIIGGSDNGFGYFAADQFLHYGAKKVILADNNGKIGFNAAQKLCKAHGKNRARFYSCDIKNSCHLKGIFKSSYCSNEKISILFNDIDAIQSLPDSCLNYSEESKQISNTQRVTRVGLENMSGGGQGNNDNSPGIIINCASILGFVGWPNQPEPIYCGTESTIQTTVDMAKQPGNNDKGLRIVCLCPANREFKSIGLPDFPSKSVIEQIWPTSPSGSCAPDPGKDKGRLGKALVHVMAYAETGSVWLVEPPFTLHEMPRLLEFPEKVEAKEG